MKRRTLVGGLVVALAAAGSAAWKFHLFGKHYPPTPYDDLLNQIVDREPAAHLGAIVLSRQPALTADALAVRLRRSRLALPEQAVRDTQQNRMMEIGGWVVPESVGLYAALAAKV